MNSNTLLPLRFTVIRPTKSISLWRRRFPGDTPTDAGTARGASPPTTSLYWVPALHALVSYCAKWSLYPNCDTLWRNRFGDMRRISIT